MASFVTPQNGDDALAEHVAQLTEDFAGLRNIPIGLTGINDAAAYSLTVKNAGTGSKGLIVYAADGATVLLQVDGNGVYGSPTGGAGAPIATTTGTQTLTNKTLTSPHMTGPVVDSGGLTVTAGTVTLTAGPLTIGSTVAASGSIRLPNLGYVAWRNGANTGDLNIGYDGNNFLRLDCTVAATASVGGGQAVPATVLGYLQIQLGATNVKVPYFAA